MKIMMFTDMAKYQQHEMYISSQKKIMHLKMSNEHMKKKNAPKKVKL